MKDETSNALGQPQRNNWGAMVSYMEAFLTQIRAISKLTLLTAHMQSFDDEQGNTLAFFPSSITKNHGMKSLPWMVDEVWYAKIEPEGMGNVAYTVDGSYINKVCTRTRSSFGKTKHNDIGLVGVLEKVGYKYGKKAAV